MDPTIGLNLFDSADKLFLSLGIVVTLTFLISLLMSKLGRPIVLSGIIAGFVIHNLNLPTNFFNPNTCDTVGSLGIVLFMMLVGNQLDYQNLIRRKINIFLSSLPLIIPFIIGFACAIYLIHINFASIFGRKFQILFSLFFALAISMTALPLVSMFLANNDRIDRKVGHLALFCASISEVIFWVILGFVLLYFQQNGIVNNFKPVYILLYLFFIFIILPKIINYFVARITTLRSMLGFIMVGCLFSSAMADLVNLHQVFGGFVFGVLLPRDNTLVKEIKARISDLVNSLLLPAYFVKTGITADLNFTWELSTLYLGLGITIIAILAKFGSSLVAGKLMGYSVTQSALLGSLLNMRGIFEIMLLNIGLEVGIINDQFYSILIIMTLIATFTSTVLSNWFNKFIKT